MITIVYIILAWLLFNFITKFVIPVYRTTKQVKQQFKNMADAQKQYQAQNNPQNQPSQNNAAPTSNTLNTENVGEYIDFEEVKK